MKILNFENFKKINESSFNNFIPDVIKNKIVESLFKKLMPETSETQYDAENQINQYGGGTMFIHYQYHNVKYKNEQIYRINQQQYWLNDAQLRMQGRDSNEKVTVTKITLHNITDKNNEINLGSTYVYTDVFLKELYISFDVIDRIS